MTRGRGKPRKGKRRKKPIPKNANSFTASSSGPDPSIERDIPQRIQASMPRAESSPPKPKAWRRIRVFPSLDSMSLTELQDHHQLLKYIVWTTGPLWAVASALVVLWYTVYLDKITTKIEDLKEIEQRANAPIREGVLVPGKVKRPELTYARTIFEDDLRDVPPEFVDEIRQKLEPKREQPPADIPILLLGDNVVRATDKFFPQCIIRQNNEDLMTLDQTSDGLLISAKLFNVLAMGLNPSPSGETFRFFVLL